MANPDFGTGKSLVVLAIVVGCFAILWPKIFYPMMQTAFAMTSPKVDGDTSYQETDRPPHLHPGSINPRLRNSPMSNDVEDKFHMREGRPFPHPQARQPVKTPPKSGGAMSIIMPIYTVGIIVFFLYTVLKLVFKKPSENEKKPMIKDFHMDPQYRKFMCDGQPTKHSDDTNANKIKPKSFEPPINEAKDLDPKDYEIYKLKKKLEETEEAMNRIMKHMGAMSACLTGMDKNIPQNENSDVRLRYKENSNNSEIEKSDEGNNADKSKILSELKCQMLQEDLAKAMFSAAQVSMKSCSEKLSENAIADNLDQTESDDQAESEVERNSDEQSESCDEEDASTDEQKINKSCYANGCCNVYEQPEKVQ